jgi:hypothetical protein
MLHFTIKKDHAEDKGNYWEALQFIGLETTGVPVMRRPLLFGGITSFQNGGNPFTGCKRLIVNQGGLRNKEAPPMVKRLFKEKVTPPLVENLTGLAKRFNGRLHLHFGEGVLQKVEIEAK